MEKKRSVDVNKPYIFNGKIVFVHDGVVYDAVCDLGFRVFHRVRIKLDGIDIPFIRSPHDNERDLACRAKQCAMKILLNRAAILQTYKDRTAYDRWLGSVFIKEDTACAVAKVTFCGVQMIDVCKYMQYLADNDFDESLIDISNIVDL